MADLIELYEKARLLNLQNLAHGKIDLNREAVSNLDYLDYVFSTELELRRQAAIQRNKNASRLPQRVFDPSRLKPGIAWQVEQLDTLQWIEEEQNIILIGRCDTGKTTLAAHIGQMALERKETVYSDRMKALEEERGQLQDTAVKYAEVRTWLNTFIEQTMQGDALTTVDGTTLKMLVDRILVKNDGIEVQFSCGVSVEKAYVR